jgi:hypothetical protein
MLSRLTPEFRMINESRPLAPLPVSPMYTSGFGPARVKPRVISLPREGADNSGTRIINCAAKKGLGSIGVSFQ